MRGGPCQDCPIEEDRAGSLGLWVGAYLGPERVTADCIVVRGQDPLDVLQTQVRHNLWIILDLFPFVTNGDGQASTARVTKRAVLHRKRFFFTGLRPGIADLPGIGSAFALLPGTIP